jgi:histidine triad (HIT) family protein
MSKCVFCEIIAGRSPGKKFYEDEHVFVFHDIHPAAPTHLLICPKEHHERFISAPPEIMSMLFEAVKIVAKKLGVDQDGFRLIINNGRAGGQTIDHLHIHFLAGKRMIGF